METRPAPEDFTLNYLWFSSRSMLGRRDEDIMSILLPWHCPWSIGRSVKQRAKLSSGLGTG